MAWFVKSGEVRSGKARSRVDKVKLGHGKSGPVRGVQARECEVKFRSVVLVRLGQDR